MVDVLWVWFSVGLMVANVATLAVLAWALFWRHRHAWDEWSEWIEDGDIYGDVRAMRYRVCEGCTAVEKQHAGRHHCHVTRNSRNASCPHLQALTGREARIKRLEKDLGL